MSTGMGSSGDAGSDPRAAHVRMMRVRLLRALMKRPGAKSTATARWGKLIVAVGLATFLAVIGTGPLGCGGGGDGEAAPDRGASAGENRAQSADTAGQGDGDDAARAAQQAAGTAASGSEPRSESPFTWPDEPTAIAVLDVKDHGRMRIGLYAQLAPATVAQFIQAAQGGVYEGTQFHRVIKDFMIQGGDPTTKVLPLDPSEDAHTTHYPSFNPPDEFSQAQHVRGVVSMANRGKPNSASTQFFIVQKPEAPALDGKYTVFGRVLDGIEVVDSIAEVETDVLGRWIAKDHPIEPVILEHVSIEVGGEVEGEGGGRREPAG